jgi:hypothetical protein
LNATFSHFDFSLFFINSSHFATNKSNSGSIGSGIGSCITSGITAPVATDHVALIVYFLTLHFVFGSLLYSISNMLPVAISQDIVTVLIVSHGDTRKQKSFVVVIVAPLYTI